ncbi:hypothetical protein MNEG_12720 [Monoraphidium neglectum]|uniref:BolA-like protein 3 n=1 Tax=Monoraphidium neglectum TaxID=145388 RepID=A0A0D2KHI4_9CHLO|nr:hypothetical protein MNEG_12720 [Monoraphidium neglectum]KIY95243.1 hypothetical protein MNEG_12720 [Monoraphidium neglectum]|eukprot:XP_013894263.1 hypothetical protein MNEG_12720 [Monoraphidium neglectum]
MLRTAFGAGGGLLRGASRVVFGGAASSSSSGRPLTTSRPAAAPEVLGNTDTERAIAEKIAGGLTGATSVRVEDTSGGCGTMYAIEVTASDFDGRSKIKQHQLVTKLISDDVKQWHGFQLVTKTP